MLAHAERDHQPRAEPPRTTERTCFLGVAFLLSVVMSLAPLGSAVAPALFLFHANAAAGASQVHPPLAPRGLGAKSASGSARPTLLVSCQGRRCLERPRSARLRPPRVFPGVPPGSTGRSVHARLAAGVAETTPPHATRNGEMRVRSLPLEPYRFSMASNSPWLATCPFSGFLRQRPPRLLRREGLLRNPVRAALVAEVQTSPGLHQRELMRRLGLGKGDLEYHLHVLKKADVLRSMRVDGRTMYFDATKHPDARDAAPVGTDREILDCIRTHGLDSTLAIARELGLSYGTVSYHVRKLREEGVLEARRGPDGLVLRAP